MRRPPTCLLASSYADRDDADDSIASSGQNRTTRCLGQKKNKAEGARRTEKLGNPLMFL